MDLILRVTLLLGLYVSLAVCKVCRGTNNGLSTQGNHLHAYETHRVRYSNCTLVDGNLEITFLNQQENYDLSFLSSIREITGYMLIVGVHTDELRMTSLRIIRGRTLYSQRDDTEQYSLFLSNNYMKGSNHVGLKKLLFTSLREIVTGDVYLKNNLLLCNDNTILWQDIVTGENVHIHIEDDDGSTRRLKDNCKPCNSSCERFEGEKFQGERFCWGPGRDECQTLTWFICSKQCESRCFGKQPNECCHVECAGGCTGPSRTDCWACKHFTDVDECVAYCPPLMIYDHHKFKNIPNPNAKYSYGSLCVNKCPSYLVEESGACVKECGFGKYADDGRCVKCNGPCPKTCAGFEDSNSFLSYKDLTRFEGCTSINGNLQILESTFSGDWDYDEDRALIGVHPSNLSVFNEVREITGFLSIQGKHPDLLSADFLPKLHTIYGRNLYNKKYSLAIVGTSFHKIGLIGLQELKHGKMILYLNPDLCYIDKTDFSSLFTGPPPKGLNQAMNRDEDKCMSNGFVCHLECSNKGCWGPAATECLSCLHFKLEDTCIEHCNHKDMRYSTENRTCHACHKECLSTCNGSGNGNCDACRNVKDGPFCMSACPESKYPDENLVCQKCHDHCTGGCTGPKNTIGPGACNSCNLAQVDEDWNVEKCLPESPDCSDGYFRGNFAREENSTLGGIRVCRKCHNLCRTCNGPGRAYCTECKYFVQDMSCVDNCYSDYYADNLLSMCSKCDPQCLQCNGPNATDCQSCRGNKVYMDTPTTDVGNSSSKFLCVDACPPEKPYKEVVGDGTKRETVCQPEAARSEDLKMRSTTTNGIIAAVVIIFVICVAIIMTLLIWRHHKSEQNKLKIAARFSGLEEGEPLTPTNVSPDMAVMRLITERELRKGNIIGSGAFGTVYKGMWVPTDENVKIPVAIKVLQESTSPSQNKELLEEARVMASVDHPYCVRILAVCMTAQMMLITQLMPFGCLLDYVRNNRSNIGSKVLLNWCTQIARGMTYLEDRGVVHRDLAARNVLIQSPANIKITDFGLAKLLDINQDEYKSSGGKMPIKWLALECIQHRIFTHKSDVWSYGVTVWELFTYGQRPYDNLRARDVPDLLEKGERLPQPSICTIDVYMIMIKCWMLDAESRPGFKELAEEFSKMARDPGRYLVIQGDKLMRLPSQTYNKEELLHSMSIAEEGTEEFVDAEDYLQPTVTLPPTNGVIPKMPDNSPYDNDRGSQDPMSRDAQAGCSNPYQHSQKRPTANGAMSWSKKGGINPGRDSVNSRYSPDPCKVLDDLKEGEANGVALPHILQPPPLGEGGPADVSKRGKILMPSIDEDDYLTPKSSQPSPYMDLIEGKDYVEPVCTPEGQYLEPQSPNAMDNPEYFQSGPGPDGDMGIESLKSHKEPPRLRSPSDESTASSEAEYYNECDKLNYHKGGRGGPVAVISPSMPESVV